MENSSNNNKPKNSFLKYLPKAASAVSFQNPQFSPGRDHHHNSGKLKAHAHKGFSGPFNFSVLPEEARGKPKNNGSFEAHEPTSPKVSCMGQIKHKHKQIKKLSKIVSTKNNDNNVCISGSKTNSEKLNKKSSSSISKFFNRSQKPGKKASKGTRSSSSDDDHGKNGRIATLDHNISVPTLGKMNKFASGRETLADFDWTAQIAPLDHDREYYSDDEERRRDHSDDDDDDDDREVIIPYSAPILLVGGRSSLSRGGDDQDDDVMGDLEPRKEVNLWKRRTMAPPPPLALNSK